VDGVRLGACEDLPDGEAMVVPAELTGAGTAIAVFNSDDEFYALDDICSHGAASLSEGWIEDGRVECPLHGSMFCLRSGAAVTLPATAAVRTHRVEVVDGDLWLRVSDDR
jgi:3-phenylpropionate/trans-cinnamate dioxygenase ferredoxin subunit